MTTEERFEKWWNTPNQQEMIYGFLEDYDDIPLFKLKELAWTVWRAGYGLGYLKGIE